MTGSRAISQSAGLCTLQGLRWSVLEASLSICPYSVYQYSCPSHQVHCGTCAVTRPGCSTHAALRNMLTSCFLPFQRVQVVVVSAHTCPPLTAFIPLSHPLPSPLSYSRAAGAASDFGHLGAWRGLSSSAALTVSVTQVGVHVAA